MQADWRSFGHYRVTAACPPLVPGAVADNTAALTAAIRAATARDASLVLLPELAITGFSLEDLFAQPSLGRRVRRALVRIAAATADGGPVVVVGAPWDLADGRLLNAAFVLAGGRVVAAVPKTHLPNHGEFYDARWFVPAPEVEQTVVDPLIGEFVLGTRLLFEIGALRFAVEVCEDLWAPDPPGVRHALAGANLIVNPSASNELVAKADYRRDLVRMASAQRICGYLYASAGPGESSRDVVFGGHLLAAENGVVLGEGERFPLHGGALDVEFDTDLLHHDRLRNRTFAGSARPGGYRSFALGDGRPVPTLSRRVDPHPFVPADETERDARAAEILAIQSAGLARRMQATGLARLVIGLSGGLDSTLALLVCLEAVERLGLDRTHILPVTMPGPGTSTHTLESVRRTTDALGLALRSIDIGPAVAQHLADLGRDPAVHDITFENTQARERTQLLFDLANAEGGIVVGTGDLSELALGWCTYNGDHMASYSVNASVPKTLVRYLVRWYARHRADAALADVLERVHDTPVSPELVPGRNAESIGQVTEDIVGPYELHDFFLYHFMRHGASPRRIRALAEVAFRDTREPTEIDRWLRVFLTRFFSQQFKRTALPAGPKVGSVSLSPRGDWRMPDEASVRDWIEELDASDHK